MSRRTEDFSAQVRVPPTEIFRAAWHLHMRSSVRTATTGGGQAVVGRMRCFGIGIETPGTLESVCRRLVTSHLLAEDHVIGRDWVPSREMTVWTHRC